MTATTAEKTPRAPSTPIMIVLTSAYEFGGLAGLIAAIQKVGNAKARPFLNKMAKKGLDDVKELVSQLYPAAKRGRKSVSDTYKVDKKGVLRINALRADVTAGEKAAVRVIDAGEIEGATRKSILVTFG